MAVGFRKNEAEIAVVVGAGAVVGVDDFDVDGLGCDVAGDDRKVLLRGHCYAAQQGKNESYN